jgi:hypothetical protein
MKLGRSLNFGVDACRYAARHRRKAADRNPDLFASILIISPTDEDRWHEQGAKDQQQQPDADTHGGHTRGLGDPEPSTRQNRRDATNTPRPLFGGRHA